MDKAKKRKMTLIIFLTISFLCSTVGLILSIVNGNYGLAGMNILNYLVLAMVIGMYRQQLRYIELIGMYHEAVDHNIKLLDILENRNHAVVSVTYAGDVKEYQKRLKKEGKRRSIR